MRQVVRGTVHGATERARQLRPAEVEAHLLARDATLIDVREREELDAHGWIAGSIHVPRGLLASRADPASPMHRSELDPQRLTIVYSGADDRSVRAVRTLGSLGYVEVAELQGGIAAWKRAGAPVAGLAPWHRLDDDRCGRPAAIAARTQHHHRRERT